MPCPTDEQLLRTLYVDETIARVRAETALARLPRWARELAEHENPDDVLLAVVDRAIKIETSKWKVNAPHRVGAEALTGSIKLALRGYFMEDSSDES